MTKNDNSKYADGWTMIFNKPKSRKAQPKNSLSQIHQDKSKVIPRKYKYNNIEEE